MRLLQDPDGLWIGRPALFPKLQGNRPPVAISDARFAEVDGPALRVAVLANDVEPDGEAMTLVSAYAALGTAVAEADGTVTYTPPAGLTGPDTVVYEISDPGGQTDTGQVDIVIGTPVLSVTETATATLDITAATGAIDIMVAEGAFAGTYQVDTALLTDGPVNLAPPTVSGMQSPGETMTAAAGLWLHDASVNAVQEFQWLRDGVAIPGATGSTHVVLPADTGTLLDVVETMSDPFGSRSASSAALAFLPSDDAALIGWWDADDAATITHDTGAVERWAAKIGAPDLEQTFASAKPVTGQRLAAGRNLIDFSGSTHNLQGTGALALPASGDFAIHMVFEVDNVATEYAAILSVDATNDFQIDAGATQFDGRLNATGIGSGFSFTGGPFAGLSILSAVFDASGSGTAEIFMNGVSRGSMTLTAPVDPSVIFRVMTNRGLNAFIDGAVGEIVITGDVNNRGAHHAYLATKWGIS